jgi:hypothetical protein
METVESMALVALAKIELPMVLSRIRIIVMQVIMIVFMAQ